MGSSTMISLLLLVIGAASTWTAAASTSHFVSVCNHASEPTFSEIFSFVSPIAPSDLAGLAGAVEGFTAAEQQEQQQLHEAHHWLLIRAFKELVTGAGRALAETKVPLSSLVSDGVFTLSTSSYQGLAVDSEIKLLQKKPFLQRHMCSLAHLPLSLISTTSSLSWLQAPLAIFSPAMDLLDPCRCWSGLSLADAALTPSLLGGGLQGQEADWCVQQDPCEDSPHQLKGDECSIRVDPLRPACAVFLVSNSVGEEEEFERKGDPVTSHYRFHVPMLLDSALLHSWLPLLSAPLQLVLSLLPLYPCTLLLAASFLAVEKAVSRNAVVQVAVTALLGVLLAAIILVVLIYRNLETLSSRLPFASWLPSFLSSGLLIAALGSTTYSLREVVCSQLWSFWLHGAFGYPLAGKLYFAASVSVALLLKRYYRLFSRKSGSYRALRKLLQCGALWVMARHASPSLELGCVFALLCLCRDRLSQWLDGTAVEVVGYMQQTPSIHYSGQAPLSQEQYQQQGKQHTAQALAALQQHLQANPSELYDLTDRYLDEGREMQSHMLDKFVRGEHSGLPRERDRMLLGSDSDDDSDWGSDGGVDSDSSSDSGMWEEQRRKKRRQKQQKTGKSRWVGATGVMVLSCALAAVLYYFHPRQWAEWSDGLSELSGMTASALRALLEAAQGEDGPSSEL